MTITVKTYPYVERTKSIEQIEYLLSNFNTIFYKVSSISNLNDILSILKEKHFDISLTEEKWKQRWIQSCLNNQEEIAIEINVTNQSVNTISYNVIIAELEELNFWSEKKLKRLGRIAIVTELAKK